MDIHVYKYKEWHPFRARFLESFEKYIVQGLKVGTRCSYQIISDDVSFTVYGECEAC